MSPATQYPITQNTTSQWDLLLGILLDLFSKAHQLHFLPTIDPNPTALRLQFSDQDQRTLRNRVSSTHIIKPSPGLIQLHREVLVETSNSLWIKCKWCSRSNKHHPRTMDMTIPCIMSLTKCTMVGSIKVVCSTMEWALVLIIYRHLIETEVLVMTAFMTRRWTFSNVSNASNLISLGEELEERGWLHHGMMDAKVVKDRPQQDQE